MTYALGHVVPVLRMFDVAKAREFYVEFLGFEVVFEHRFGDDFPLYMGLKRENGALHLSEHHGDATPGSHVRISVTGIDALAADLQRKSYRHAKPGVAGRTPWGTAELTITDPFGNRLTFTEAV